MYYINYVGFATHSQLFWELCWELFLVNRPNLHLHLVNSLAKCTLTKKNLVNRLSVNTQSSAFSEGWPKVHSVNSKFGQSGTDERNVLYKSLPVTGFEPQTHGIGSAHSTNWATTTAHSFCLFSFFSHSANCNRPSTGFLRYSGLPKCLGRFIVRKIA